MAQMGSIGIFLRVLSLALLLHSVQNNCLLEILKGLQDFRLSSTLAEQVFPLDLHTIDTHLGHLP